MGKSSSAITGYRYRLSVVMWLYEGAIDEIFEFKYGERLAYKYDPSAPEYVPESDVLFGPMVGPDGGDQINQNVRINGDANITIRAFQILGGDEREGGVWGDVAIRMGKSAVPDPYLASKFGADTPAYVGCTSLIFKDFIWSANNPYFKPIAVLTRNLRQNWRDDVVWYPEKLDIGPFDMNPAHIIYQLITSKRFSMAYPTSEINDANFRLAADQFHAEGFGLSGIWDQDSSVEEFIGIVASTVNCELRLGESNGLFELVLIRDNYTVDELTGVGPDNIVSMSSFQRAGYGELGNTLTVMYTDREQVQQPYTMNDAAAISKQGGKIIPVKREYLLIREPELAGRVCARDLALISSTLAKATLTTDRLLHKHQKGDVIAFTWPDLGIVKAPFRILSIDKKNILDGTVDVELVEDVFGLPNNSYVGLQESQWSNPSGPPEVAVIQRADEVNYRDIKRYLPAEQAATLNPEYCFGRVAVEAPDGAYFNFKLATSPTAGGTYQNVSTGYFCGTATLVNTISAGSLTMQLSGLTTSSGITPGEYALIDDEAVLVTGINLETGIVNIGRGVIDTVPVQHTAGARVWFPEVRNAVDPTQRLPGTGTYYKPLPTTGYGSLPASAASAINLGFVGRAQRPYAPGGLKINGAAYPEWQSGLLTITWSHRNRLTQSDQLIDTTVASIPPESGTTYKVQVRGEAGSVIFSDNTITGDIATLPQESDLGSGLLNASAGRVLKRVGFEPVTSTLSTALATTQWGRTYSPVQGGFLSIINSTSSAEDRFRYVDATTGIETVRTANWNSYIGQFPGFNLKSGVPSFDEYFANYTNSQFIGNAVYWNDEAVSNPTVLKATGPSSPIRDRRTAPEFVYQHGVGSLRIGVSAQKVVDAKHITLNTKFFIITNRDNVVSNTAPLLTTQEYLRFYMSSANQLDDVFGAGSDYIAAMPYNSALGFNPTRAIIFGSILYNHLYTPNAPYSSSGKPVDMTNYLTAHINISTDVVLSTQIFTINGDGSLTLVSTTPGMKMADQLNGTQGFDVDLMSRQVRIVNSTTGAIVSTLGVVSHSPAAVYGDVVNNHILILGNDGVLRKYDSTLALLASITLSGQIFDPAFVDITHGTINSNYPRLGSAITAAIEIVESQGNYYVRRGNSGKGANTIYKVSKALTSYSIVTGYNPQTPMIATPGDSVILLNSTTGTEYGLVDELGVATTAPDTPSARVNDFFTVELSASRDGLESFQKHVVSVKRHGYGLRYGEYY